MIVAEGFLTAFCFAIALRATAYVASLLKLTCPWPGIESLSAFVPFFLLKPTCLWLGTSNVFAVTTAQWTWIGGGEPGIAS